MFHLFRFNVTVSGTCDWPYTDNSPLCFAHFAAESTLLFLGMNIVTLHAYLLTMPDFHVACLRVFILPPWIPFQVQPPAFYTLVAEFEARGFDSTTTPESGIRAQVLRLSSFCDVITVWLKRCTLCVELTTLSKFGCLIWSEKMDYWPYSHPVGSWRRKTQLSWTYYHLSCSPISPTDIVVERYVVLKLIATRCWMICSFEIDRNSEKRANG